MLRCQGGTAFHLRHLEILSTPHHPLTVACGGVFIQVGEQDRGDRRHVKDGCHEFHECRVPQHLLWVLVHLGPEGVAVWVPTDGGLAEGQPILAGDIERDVDGWDGGQGWIAVSQSWLAESRTAVGRPAGAGDRKPSPVQQPWHLAWT